LAQNDHSYWHQMEKINFILHVHLLEWVYFIYARLAFLFVQTIHLHFIDEWLLFVESVSAFILAATVVTFCNNALLSFSAFQLRW
jgi:hypothetical protein